MATETHVPSEKLIEYVQCRFSLSDIDLVKQACAFAEKHYASRNHPTGIPYSEYALSVAKILADLDSVPIVIAAAIISPPLSIYPLILSDLKATFNDQVELVKLVEEIFQLSNLEWDVWPESSESNKNGERKEILLKMSLLAIDGEKNEDQEQHALTAIHFQKKEKQVENIIRMFLAGVTDILALIIKLADRLQFMRLLKNLTETEKEEVHCTRLARISLTVYAPLADRLGLWQLKSELEDMSFRLLDRETYKKIGEQLHAKKHERAQAVNDIVPMIEAALAEYDIHAEVTGRAKHIYGIYKKMEAKQLALEQINDLLGVRIIVDKPEECYLVQEIIHDRWSPITSFYDGEVGRDWIATPKENGYQSLHTTVEVDNTIVEVQIRTHEMHETAEYGAAAEHWRYKDPKIYRKGKVPRVTKEKDINWGKQLVEVRKKLNNGQEAATLMQQSLLKDHIYVITPQGHVIDLRRGATPLDFAYRIHTDLGHRYTGARVDDHIVRLDYELKNGEIVELITSRARSGPSPDWLAMSKDEQGKTNYLFARTRQAREKIQNWLNKQNKNTNTQKQDDTEKSKHHDTQRLKQSDRHKQKASK